ncbi:MAG: hypothetical protein SGCHY_000435 [Lobulomycetales sp.]
MVRDSDAPRPPPFSWQAHVVYHVPTYSFIAFLFAVNYPVHYLSPWQNTSFALSDPSLSHPFSPRDIVSMVRTTRPPLRLQDFVLICFGVIPAILVLSVCILWRLFFGYFQIMDSSSHNIPKPRVRTVQYILLNDPIHHAHLFTQAILCSIGFTLLVTDLLKIWVGRLRPDFIDRCKPDESLQCTGDPDIVQEGRLSFPSGHSSSAFSGAVLIALWIFVVLLHPRRSLRLLDVFHSASFRFACALFPLMAAAYVAVSRAVQNIHHPSDVVAGACVGSAIAGFFFYQTFIVFNDVEKVHGDWGDDRVKLIV